MKNSFVTLLLFGLFQFGLFAQEVGVKLTTDSTNYLVGDYININYEIIAPTNSVILFPNINDSIPKLDFINQIPLESIDDKVNNKTKFIYRFVFAGFDSGDVTIPSFSIPVRIKGDTSIKFIATDSLVLTVHTVEVDTTKDIIDIKGMETLPIDWKNVFYYVAIVLLLLILAYLIYRYIRKKKGVGAADLEIIRLPHERALENLALLNEKQLWQKGMIKDYHTELTFIIRNYFEERFAIKALEATTKEIVDMLEVQPEAQNIVALTRDFLNNADMVKFAKFVPMPTVNEEMMKQGYNIVESTIPLPDKEDSPSKQEEADNA